MKCLALLGMLLFSAASTADEKSHMELALQFDALNNPANTAGLAKVLIPEIVKTYPALESHTEQLQLFLVSILESEDYKREKARAHMEVFSEEELVQLVALMQSPAYQILQRKRNVMTLASVMSTTSIVRRKLPEFRKGIESDIGKQ